MKEPLTAGDRLVKLSRRAEPDRSAPAKPPTRRRMGWLARLFTGLIGLMALGVLVSGIAGFVLYQRFAADLPDHETLNHYQPRMMSRVYAGDSRLLAELATERRIFVPYAAIPQVVKQAFISAEDQNFFVHKGVDPVAIVRAGVTDLMQYGQGRRPVGASTITQQVAKNMLLGNEASLSRKAREAILAIRIETSLSKERILELYLNEIYLGLQAYGVASAAQAYFNKSLTELSLPEAAFLAVLPKAPNNYNPSRFADAARIRRDWVLDRMADDRAITPAQAAEAKATVLATTSFRRPESIVGADYFAEEVRRQLIDRFGAEQTTQGGLMVRTTLDPALQLAADRALRDGLMRYDQRRGGWRGAVSSVEAGPALRTGWAAMLEQALHPAGMLAEWRLAVVLDAGDTEAKLGFVDRATLQARVLPLQLADLAWARRARDDRLGPPPRRIADVAKPGDLLMVEPVAASPAAGRAAARPERLLLRQVPQVQGALVSLDPATGRVLAMSGGWNWETSQFNRATQANRQPGSSFKPFVYLTALQAGTSPSQRFLDAPFVLDQGAAGKWRPSNYAQDFNGPVPMRIALEKSLNLVTVRIANRVGMEAVAQTAIAFHMVDSMPRVLPAALGAVETTVLRETGAYASLAAGGREVIPTLIDTVQDRTGGVIWRADGPQCAGCEDATRHPDIVDNRREIADAPSVFQLVTMMQGAVARGTGVSAGAGLNRAIAGKTGTSQDFVDNWFAGFTPDLVTVVWMGFDTPGSLGDNESGSSNAAPIWHDFMASALKGRPNLRFAVPPGVTMSAWDSGSGRVTDAFKPEQVPGASEAVVGVSASSGRSTAGGASVGGVDSGLGGLY